jgi:6-phosphogluconolactonase
MATKEILYVGTYFERGSQGIYVFEFDRNTRELKLIQTIQDRESPTYLALHPEGGMLYASNRQGVDDSGEGSLSAFAIEAGTGRLVLQKTLPSGGKNPCHISIDPLGRHVYISHYESSHMVAFNLNQAGSLGKKVFSHQFEGSGIHPERQKQSHLHSIIPDEAGTFLYVSDLGTDLIHQIQVLDGQGLEFKEKAKTKSFPGSGPRHLKVHPNGQYVISVEEITSTLSLYRIDQYRELLPVDRQEMLMPDDQWTGTNTAADLQLSPDGRFVYASNRGLDNIVVFEIVLEKEKLKFASKHSSEGAHPRSIGMDQNGEFLFVVNRETDNLVIFSIDKENGSLTKTEMEAKVPGAVAVVHHFLK